MVDSGSVGMFSARSCVDKISSRRHMNQGATSFLPSLAFAGRPCVLAKSPISFIRISSLLGKFSFFPTLEFRLWFSDFEFYFSADFEFNSFFYTQFRRIGTIDYVACICNN